MAASSNRQPLGVAALSRPNLSPSALGVTTLAKSQSMPSLQSLQRIFDPRRPTRKGNLERGQLSPLSPKTEASSPKSLSPKAQAHALRSTYHAGMVSPSLTGRMVVHGRWGVGPPSAHAYKTAVPKGVLEKMHTFEMTSRPLTQFRRFYERGDLPIALRHGPTNSVEWKVEPDRLDYNYHLPIFFEGLMEKHEPYVTLAYQGLQDMLNAARGKEPSLIAPAIPTLIIPIKRALKTKDNDIMIRCISAIQFLIRCDTRVGELLVPYYRQILPVFNLFKVKNVDLGDGIEYGQRNRSNIGDLIQETLEILERTGGDDAFINIKYMVPTYESCMVG